jgi:hypothetical protein
MAKQKLKIMLSSTVVGSEVIIENIYATLVGYGYEVLCSHKGTIYSIPGKSPSESCLKAVEDCDFFFGIIFPRYGSSITHDEFKRAIELDKPRGFLVDGHVDFARLILKQFMYDDNGKRNEFKLDKKTPIINDVRVIDMYNDAIGHSLPIENRLWAHKFYNYPLDGAPFVANQFHDSKRFYSDILKINNND